MEGATFVWSDSAESDVSFESDATYFDEVETAGPLLEWQYRWKNLAATVTKISSAYINSTLINALVAGTKTLRIVPPFDEIIYRPILRSIENSIFIGNVKTLVEWQDHRQNRLAAALPAQPAAKYFV